MAAQSAFSPGLHLCCGPHCVSVQASSFGIDTILWEAFELKAPDSNANVMQAGPLCLPVAQAHSQALEALLTATPSTPTTVLALPSQVVCTSPRLVHQTPSDLAPCAHRTNVGSFSLPIQFTPCVLNAV